jgi:hypothetical protein
LWVFSSEVKESALIGKPNLFTKAAHDGVFSDGSSLPLGKIGAAPAARHGYKDGEQKRLHCDESRISRTKRQASSVGSSFTNYRCRLLIIAHGDEHAMPQALVNTHKQCIEEFEEKRPLHGHHLISRPFSCLILLS